MSAPTFAPTCLPAPKCHTPSALAMRGRNLAANVPDSAIRAPIGGMNAPGLPRTAATRPGPLATLAPAVTHG
jgi:hypothetical protein